MSKHKASRRMVRRRGRVGVLGLALGVTILVGGTAVGVVPQLKSDPASADVGSAAPSAIAKARIDTIVIPTPTPTPKPRAAAASVTTVAKVPAASGSGRRIVFDQGDQRVWLVGEDGAVERTYRVSGSRFNNLQPGTYAVQSKTRHAGAFDGSGTMEYFVRFTTGFSAPIGFHSVPRYNNGELEQTKAELGTPLSAGCVRQWMPDAIALWDWAPIGTKVVVTA
ncbi:L,D-transpeptidase [Aeromicrobium sp.]|uniref:L,D-transpeptidase n=1 Tax=Aeromicrobium sp. TaxID=1871063 RepID=UPI0030C22030